MRQITTWATLCAILAISISFTTGCSKSDEPGKKRFLKLGTAPVGGAFNVVGQAVVDVVNENRPEGMGKFSAQGTKGTQANIRGIDDGDLDFALANAAISYFAVRGEGAWEKKYDIKVVMTLAPNVAMFVTTADSGIKSVQDFNSDVRVSMGPAGAGFDYFLRPILDAHGISYDDIDVQNATQTAAVDALGDGSYDAAFLGGAVPTGSLTQACSSQDIIFIPFEEDAINKLVEEYPFFEKKTIPADVYSDLQDDFHGLNVGAMHLITSGSQDEEVVYQFTKALYENREDVVKQHAAGKAINPKNVVKQTGVEFHPGAIRFYKEIGIWPEKD